MDKLNEIVRTLETFRSVAFGIRCAIPSFDINSCAEFILKYQIKTELEIKQKDELIKQLEAEVKRLKGEV